MVLYLKYLSSLLRKPHDHCLSHHQFDLSPLMHLKFKMGNDVAKKVKSNAARPIGTTGLQVLLVLLYSFNSFGTDASL